MRHLVKLMVALLAAAAVLVPASPAHAAGALTVNVFFPDLVQVGQSNVPASIQVVNASNAGESIFLNLLTLTPSCGSSNGGGFCYITEEDVFAPSAIAVGSAGTACSGVVFAINSEAPGRYSLRPTSPIVLSSSGPNALCRIDFTFGVSRTPTFDSTPSLPGLQTDALATAQGAVLDDPTFPPFPATGAGQDTVTVRQADATLTTNASPGGPVGTQVTDTATVTGQNPTGTVTFNLYGPGDPTCSGPTIFTSTNPMTGGGATSNPFTPPVAGTYRWVASYAGDANNFPTFAPCGAPNETVVITQASPEITTNASPGGPVGTQVTDTATVTGGLSPTGTVDFVLYDNATCSGAPVFTSLNRPISERSATSSSFTPTSAGTYYWVASYSGDANNIPTAAPCGAPNESVVINKASPEITTNASPGGPVGTQVTDTATLTGGHDPTGTVDFNLYDNATCSGAPVFASSNQVSERSATSSSFAPTGPGTYYWVASYSGDANNAATSAPCGAPNESVVITQRPHLTLVKQVVNDDGGTATPSDFTLSAVGPDTLSGAGGADGDVTAGTYTLSETNATGYTASAWVCTGTGTQSGASITLGPGESATCTITNDDDPVTDTTSPRVVSTVPSANATGVGRNVDVKARFSEAINAATVTRASFKLFKKGSTTRIAASVTYDPGLRRATLNPTNALRRGATYKVVVTTLVMDTSGNRLDQNTAADGLQPKVFYFTVAR